MSAELIETTVDGERTAFIAPEIPDAAPAVVREGLARRRLTVTEGRCPCGARPVWPNRAERRAAARSGRVLRVRVEHEDGCPATNDALAAAMGGAA